MKNKVDIILLKLVVNGIKPAVEEHFEQHWDTLVKEYPQTLAIDFVIWENRSTRILYNIKYKHLVKACQTPGRNEALFGKLMGFTYLWDGDLSFYNHHQLVVSFYIDQEPTPIMNYYKPIRTSLIKDYQLLLKMQKIDPNIYIQMTIVKP